MIAKLKQNKWIITSIFIVALLGISTKQYNAAGHIWVKNYLGGFFYVIFFCLIVFLFSKQTSAAKIAAIVFLGTCALELLQLWHPLFLQTVRNTFWGAALLGKVFSWVDIPFYLLGSITGWLLIKQLKKTV